MTIHFVCSGNTYRSRLAEAYLKSLKLEGIKVRSSGIHAGKEHILVRWYAEKILEQNKLVDFASKRPRQTTKPNLRSSDVLVFFEKSYLIFAKKLLNLKGKKTIVLNLADIDLNKKDLQIIRDTKKCFKQIKQAVNAIVSKYL